MRNKYICSNDIMKEIDRETAFIESYSNEIERSYRRIRYLTVLNDYLNDKAILPFVSKKILYSDVKLQEFVIPFFHYYDVSDNKIDFKLNFDEIAFLLHNFIDYVCKVKGHKIGVGALHINKFLRECCK